MPEIPAQAGQAASKAAQGAIGPEFWATIWVPLVSYVWTIAWVIANFAVRKAAGDAIEIKFLSKSQIVTMFLFNFIWFMLIAFFVSVIAVMICHGDGSFLGRAGAFLTRTALKIQSLGTINFDFCDQVPSIPLK